MNIDLQLIKRNLVLIVSDLSSQSDVGRTFPADLQSFADQLAQLREWIEDAGEYGLAYESIVVMLQTFPFRLSGPAAVKLLEIGLLMRFKTGLPEDSLFDSR